MADIFPPKKRSEIMARIRSSGMKPERLLGQLLRELLPPGEEIVERPKDLPGRPDFYIPRLRLAVFADGCFFHGCPKHLRMPSSIGTISPRFSVITLGLLTELPIFLLTVITLLSFLRLLVGRRRRSSAGVSNSSVRLFFLRTIRVATMTTIIKKRINNCVLKSV